MSFVFRYTGVRVRDMDKAIEFFRDVLGMKLENRINAPWNKGEFANLRSKEGTSKLELNWYAEDSPAAGPYREGDELDHLGFQVEDFDGAMKKLIEAGYPVQIGPIKAGGWRFAFFKVVDGIWLDVFYISPSKKKPKKKTKRKGKAVKRRKRSK